jgi:type IV pilus assembly protein PilV
MRRPLPATSPRVRRQAGIALIEALVAVVLLGVGLLGIIGLQARSYSALSDTGMRAEATIAADKLLGTMAADQANLAAYALAAGATAGPRIAPWVLETQKQIPGAAIKVALAPAAGTSRTRVTITISWARKANTASNQHVITSYIANAT